MSPSPEPEQPLMSLDEYITLCADLHNTLLAKSIFPDSPPPETSTNLLQRYESYRANPPFHPFPNDPGPPPSLDTDSPLVTLLSRLRTTIPPPGGSPIPLTPILYQPNPEWFFPPIYSYEIDTADPPFLLLYPQRLNSESPSDGGLFVDFYALRGIWHQDSMGPENLAPPSEKWLPLDYLLKLEIYRWESGRYMYDRDAEDGLKIQKWVPVPPSIITTSSPEVASYPNLQVAETILEWERLLCAIESRLPSPTSPPPETPETPETPKRERLPPLQPSATQNLHLGAFATHFLAYAQRPKGWTFIAPGIGTFSEASLRAAYAAEPADAYRRTSTGMAFEEEGEDWITLVLPCVSSEGGGSVTVPAPADVSLVPDSDVSSSWFDKPYGFGKATVGRRAGLYTSWADERDGDLVQLVCPSGRTEVGVFGGMCPWGPTRLPRLAEVLGHWANLVEDGVWAVGEDGVEEDAAWFDANKDLANLNWDDIEELMVCGETP